MTREEVEIIGYYDSKLKRLKDQKEELEALIGVTSPNLSGMPKGNKIGRPTENLAVRLASQIEEIKALELETAARRLKVFEWLEHLDDEMIKNIIYYKFLKHYSWTQVARVIGYGDTSTYFKMYQRFWEQQQRS